MGREIRRVPANWEHPVDASGTYRPLYDESFEEAAAEWKKNFLEFEANKPEGAEDLEYWEWENTPPDRDSYRPAFKPEERTHYQVYENVSEGTPWSPVFQFPEQVSDWLVNVKGYSRKAADNFVKDGFSCSFVIIPGRGVVDGIEGAV